MASNFPSSLDTFTNPSSSDAMDSVSVPHATQHSDLNDAVEALQAKVGADSSGVTSSHDYKIADHASRLTTLEGAAGSGLVFIASQTASSVASLSFDNCFSATYDSYLVLSKNLVGSSATSIDLYFRERNGGVDITTAGYAWAGYFSATAGGNRMYAVAQVGTMVGTVANTSCGFVLNVSNPFTSSQGTMFSLAVGWGATSANSIFSNSLLPSASAVDGFTLYPGSGTISGTVSVYGYAKV